MGDGWLGWGLAAIGGAALLLHTRRTRAMLPLDNQGDVTALARTIASEVGRGTPAERAAVAWTVRNRAERRGITVSRLVCMPWCGPQSEQSARLRPFSSAKEATADEMRLAAHVLAAPHTEDPTGGAIAFVEPALQSELAASHANGHVKSYEKLRQDWLADGQRPLGRVGRFELWTR